MKDNFEYTGKDFLEIMDTAVNYNRSIRDLLIHHISKQDSVLDFGAGRATYAKMIQVSTGVSPDCLEPDVYLRTLAKKAGLKTYSSIDKVSTQYDVVYAVNVMEHIQDDYQVFKNLQSIIKSDGILIIYVPAFNILFSSMDSMVGHFRRYKLNDLSKKLKDLNFEILDGYYADPIGFFGALYFRFFGSKKGKVNPRYIAMFDRYLFPVSRFLQPFTKKIFGKNVIIVARKV